VATVENQTSAAATAGTAMQEQLWQWVCPRMMAGRIPPPERTWRGQTAEAETGVVAPLGAVGVAAAGEHPQRLLHTFFLSWLKS